MRRVIASESGTDFGWHLEHTAWNQGVINANRMAFVADGASVNLTIHRTHFSQMTGILDLMHALSDAYRAAKALTDREAYVRFATHIWQGNVAEVIAELRAHRGTSPPLKDARDDPVAEAITYYENHRQFMNSPPYRRNGLPLTSSLIESTIKQINRRMKGTGPPCGRCPFFRKDTGETLLQLRADSISSDEPLKRFWSRWHTRQNGANRYRTNA